MNCDECINELTAYIEGVLDDPAALEAHLAGCPTCRAELEQLRQLRTRLERLRPAGGDQDAIRRRIDDEVMDRIILRQAREIGRLKMRRTIRWAGMGVAAAAALVLLGVMLWAPSVDQRALAAETMAKAAERSAGIKTVHYQARMRTLPGDNFSFMGSQYEFVPIEVWRQLGRDPIYRIEKPRRVLVSNAASTTMWIKSGSGGLASEGPAGASFDAGWIRDFADVESLLTLQQRQALAQGWDLTIRHDEQNGQKLAVVTVLTHPQNVGDYLRNKFLDTSDTRRVFRFDKTTGRLKDVQIYLVEKTGETLVFEVTSIEYDPPMPEGVFSLKLPDNVVWYQEPKVLPDNERYAAMKPEEAARAFFEACGKEDWDEVAKFMAMSGVHTKMRESIGGLVIISLGEPFQSAGYSGWYVPYEIKSRDGSPRKYNLALRNDNPAKRWVVDGGF